MFCPFFLFFFFLSFFVNIPPLNLRSWQEWRASARCAPKIWQSGNMHKSKFQAVHGMYIYYLLYYLLFIYSCS
ncbi:hypothetical protein I7I50_11404 [Histoplasma capsulatum G186AR]|uniref:Uncharacterized protein n=1 Tax=Ajellomyces capsulatus TaxID=5037 RepID=A0A8H7Z881_AJECA|nr:hypothetical protein I7I52_02642 [Histoplasma capsulatum]QSS69944.1 hypothetical protein I7I50_11404 [Histoplasma capsulatum G186AR]